MKKLVLMTICALLVGFAAEAKTIRGKVVDSGTGDPLIGATVTPVGGGQGTATDVEGNFTLNVPDKTKELNVTYVGMKAKRVSAVPGVVAELESNESQLDEVVVVAYGTAKKESLTGSVSQIDASQIETRVATSATAALEGAAPGVQVNNSYGEPGAGPSILIRGVGTITGTTAPLYVVDGVPYDGNINDISSHDIASISVLKDAASAALYGNRAANGVVIITTKNGRNTGKPTVSLQINEGFYNRGIPYYNRTDATQWMGAMWTAARNKLLTANPDMSIAEANAAAPSNTMPMNRYNVFDREWNNIWDANGNVVANVLPGYTDLNWEDAVQRTGFRQEYVVSGSASGEKYNVSASASYLNEKGYVLATDFERFSAFANATFKPVKWFDANFKLQAGTQKRSYNPNANGTYYANPFYMAGTMAPVYPYYAHNEDGSIIEIDGVKQWNVSSVLSNRNIAYELREDVTQRRRNTIDGTAGLNFYLPYGFGIHVLGNLSTSTTNRKDYNNPVIGDGAANNGRLNFYDYLYRTWNFQQQITWNKSYGKNNIDVLLGHENYGYWEKVNYGMKTDMIIPGDNYNLSNFATTSNLNGYENDDRKESYLARVNYNFDGRYYVQASYRRDGSSRFSKKSRWGNFYSVGARWNIKNESFLKDNENVNALALRASWGQVGSDMGVGLYAYQALYEQDINGGNGVLIMQSLAANDLKWETTQTTDVAVEGRLWNRFNFSVGFYDKQSKDLLFAVALPGSAGSNPWGDAVTMTQYKNIGTISNRGVELAFDVDAIKTADWKWNIGIDATIPWNKVIKLPDGTDIPNGTKRISEGHSIFEYYTYHFEGVDQMTGRSLYTIDPEKAADAAQNDALVTINGKDYTTITSYAIKDWCGVATPKIYGALNTNLSWKDLSLGLLFTYSIGGKIYDSGYQSLMTVTENSPSALHVDALKGWNGVPAGMTETSANRIDPNGIPALNYRTSSDDNSTSDRWLTNASYLVFKNINLNYNLPRNFVRRIGLQGVSISVSADNLFTVTARKGINPQYSYSGSQDNTYVTARAFNFGLNVKF